MGPQACLRAPQCSHLRPEEQIPVFSKDSEYTVATGPRQTLAMQRRIFFCVVAAQILLSVKPKGAAIDAHGAHSLLMCHHDIYVAQSLGLYLPRTVKYPDPPGGDA